MLFDKLENKINANQPTKQKSWFSLSNTELEKVVNWFLDHKEVPLQIERMIHSWQKSNQQADSMQWKKFKQLEKIINNLDELPANCNINYT